MESTIRWRCRIGLWPPGVRHWCPGIELLRWMCTHGRGCGLLRRGRPVQGVRGGLRRHHRRLEVLRERETPVPSRAEPMGEDFGIGAAVRGQDVDLGVRIFALTVQPPCDRDEVTGVQSVTAHSVTDGLSGSEDRIRERRGEWSRPAGHGAIVEQSSIRLARFSTMRGSASHDGCSSPWRGHRAPPYRTRRRAVDFGGYLGDYTPKSTARCCAGAAGGLLGAARVLWGCCGRASRGCGRAPWEDFGVRLGASGTAGALGMAWHASPHLAPGPT